MIRKIDDELYQTLCEWWESYGFPILPISMISKALFSFVDDRPAMFASGYFTDDRNLCFVTYWTANPESTDLDREIAFKELVEEYEIRARDKGIPALFTCSNNPSLIQRITNVGFIKADENTAHFYKPLLKGKLCHN